MLRAPHSMASLSCSRRNGPRSSEASQSNSSEYAVARKKAEEKAQQLAITQVRSGIGRPQKHKNTLRALGLKKHQHTVVLNDSPAIRGMVFQVRHLVEVTEIAQSEEA